MSEWLFATCAFALANGTDVVEVQVVVVLEGAAVCQGALDGAVYGMGMRTRHWRNLLFLGICRRMEGWTLSMKHYEADQQAMTAGER